MPAVERISDEEGDAQPLRRPALAAQRAVDVINLLAAHPRRSFTLTEIMRATTLNVSSCHALLRVLADAAYVARGASAKTYMLGPALLAAGLAAWDAQPLVQRAQAAAPDLAKAVGLPVLLTTVADDEIVAVLSIADAEGRPPGLHPGARTPMAAPLGAPFVAWADEQAIEQWVTRRAPPDATILAEWQRELALVRQRGFQVTLRPASVELAAVMRDIAEGTAPLTVREEWETFFSTPQASLSQPDTIVDEALYDIVSIAAPLFNADRHVAFSLGLSGFSGPLAGREIKRMADELLRTCVKIMRD